MRYKVTNQTLPRVTELCELIATTRATLGGLGADAHREWDRLRSRFPSNDDLDQGFISLSELELEELHATLLGFCHVMASSTRAPAAARGSRARVSTERFQPAA